MIWPGGRLLLGCVSGSWADADGWAADRSGLAAHADTSRKAAHSAAPRTLAKITPVPLVT
jgi:hypothetical protein